MIRDKMLITHKILEKNSSFCGDNGSGDFLNHIAKYIYYGKIDFNKFSPESWTRARRKVLELNPILDKRTRVTKEQEEQIKKECK